MSAYSLIRSLTEEPTTLPAEDEPRGPEQSSVPVLTQFVGKIQAAPTGTVRYVLRMSIPDLTTLYLKKGGGEDFVKGLDDEKITALANSPIQGEDTGIEEIQAMPKDYTFTQLITSKNPSHDAVVLLNIPTAITAELESAKGDPNGARAALAQMMNHKFYVMTIQASRAQKIRKPVEKAWKNQNDLALHINPTIVIAYPNSEELADIKDAWGDTVNAHDEATNKANDAKAAKAQQAPQKPGDAAQSPADAAPAKTDGGVADLERAYDLLNTQYVDRLGAKEGIGAVMNDLKKRIAAAKAGVSGS